MGLLTKETTKATEGAHSLPEARRAFVLQRSGGACEYRTGGCTGGADRLLVDAGWAAHGMDGAPAFAVRAVCGSCFSTWAR